MLCISDDVLIHGKCDADHDANLLSFVQKCQEKGIKLNRDKLEYKCKKVSFHGHLLATEGVKPDPHKVAAFIEMSRPERTESPDDVLRLKVHLTRLR